MDVNKIVVLTYDSCRYDSFMGAANRFCTADPAYAYATMTGPSHWALFTGYLPHVFNRAPYINRHIRSLWTLHGAKTVDPLIPVTSNRSFVHGLREKGYFTAGFGSRAWFDNEWLIEDFDVFNNIGTDAQKQALFAREAICGKSTYFLFVNFGETHIPYTCKTHSWSGPEDWSSMYSRRGTWRKGMSDDEVAQDSGVYVFPEEIDSTMGRRLWLQQVKCCEHINKYAKQLIDLIQPDILVITADHGDCFGERNPFSDDPELLWGHSLPHYSVLQVPLYIHLADHLEIDNSVGTQDGLVVNDQHPRG